MNGEKDIQEFINISQQTIDPKLEKKIIERILNCSTTLDFSNQSEEEKINDLSIKIISERMNQKADINHLNLRGNKIKDKGIEYLSKSLKKNSKIKRIDLSKNLISDQSIRILSEVLITNSTIEEIYLNELKNISENGLKFLLDSLCFNHNLKVLSFDDNSHIGSETKMRISNLLKENQQYPESAEKRVQENLKNSRQYKGIKILKIYLVKKKKLKLKKN